MELEPNPNVFFFHCTPSIHPSTHPSWCVGGYWCTLVVELLDFSQSEPMHQLPILSMGWAAFFSSSLDQSIFFGF
jgi:hypothetical protein